MKEVKVFLLIPVIAFALTFADAIKAPNVNGEMKTLKIGALLSLSGSYGPNGIACLRGFELMADKINAEGGIKVGDNNYRIELVKADGKTDMNVILAQANRLIFNEKVKFIGGPMMSGDTLAIFPLTEPNKVMVFCVSYSPKVLGPDKKYSFRLIASGAERLKAIFPYLKEHRPDVKTVALLGPNHESGWGTSKVARENAEGLGFQVVFEDFFDMGTKDFFPILTKMMTKKPDVLIPHSLMPGFMGLILQQKHQLGYTGMIITPSHFDPKMLVEKAGVEAVEGFTYQSPNFTGPDALPGHRELYTSYKEKYKEDFMPTAETTYPYLRILQMAIEKAGTLDTTRVAEVMENLEGEYPYGHFSIGGLKTYGAKRQIVAPIFMSEIRNGKGVGLGSVTPPIP